MPQRRSTGRKSSLIDHDVLAAGEHRALEAAEEAPERGTEHRYPAAGEAGGGDGEDVLLPEHEAGAEAVHPLVG